MTSEWIALHSLATELVSDLGDDVEVQIIPHGHWAQVTVKVVAPSDPRENGVERVYAWSDDQAKWVLQSTAYPPSR